MSTQFYILRDNRPDGPYTPADLHRLGLLSPETQIWVEEKSKWMAARDVEGFEILLASATVIIEPADAPDPVVPPLPQQPETPAAPAPEKQPAMPASAKRFAAIIIIIGVIAAVYLAIYLGLWLLIAANPLT